jgi:hypothetical protein
MHPAKIVPNEDGDELSLNLGLNCGLRLAPLHGEGARKVHDCFSLQT